MIKPDDVPAYEPVFPEIVKENRVFRSIMHPAD